MPFTLDIKCPTSFLITILDVLVFVLWELLKICVPLLGYPGFFKKDRNICPEFVEYS